MICIRPVLNIQITRLDELYQKACISPHELQWSTLQYYKYQHCRLKSDEIISPMS